MSFTSSCGESLFYRKPSIFCCIQLRDLPYSWELYVSQRKSYHLYHWYIDGKAPQTSSPSWCSKSELYFSTSHFYISKLAAKKKQISSLLWYQKLAMASPTWNYQNSMGNNQGYQTFRSNYFHRWGWCSLMSMLSWTYDLRILQNNEQSEAVHILRYDRTLSAIFSSLIKHFHLECIYLYIFQLCHRANCYQL